MAANQTNREIISSSFHLPSTEQRTMVEIEILKHKIKTLKNRKKSDEATKRLNPQGIESRVVNCLKNWIATADASDLQGEKGCDITEMPQTQITH